MLIYEYENFGHLNKIMFRLEDSNTKIRYTKIINNQLYHITKDIAKDVTFEDIMELTKRVATLDDIFWKLL